MSQDSDLKKFCIDTYQTLFNKEFQRLISLTCQRNQSTDLSVAKLNEIETEAQKYAIKESIILGMSLYPLQISKLWHYIYEAHVYRKSGIDDLAVIRDVISADQSWKKSSGHAFEEVIKELASSAMGDLPVKFILQRDLNALIKAGEIANEPRDISWLKEQIKANIFDLYAIVTVDGKNYCFGCIQCKTSIRDRVTRDREPSIHAMESYFWSIIFVLDSEYLRNPKFQNMVNGGTEEFPGNGWHGMYDVSSVYNVERIYPLDRQFTLLRRHVEKAVNDWLNRRQWFKSDWRAE